MTTPPFRINQIVEHIPTGERFRITGHRGYYSTGFSRENVKQFICAGDIELYRKVNNMGSKQK